MTTYANHKVWQDVYHFQFNLIDLYIKFMKDDEGHLIVSFKERSEDMKKECPFCKTCFLERKTIKETYTYKGQRFEIEQPGEFCTLCDEGVLNANDLKSTEKQIRDFQAKIDGLLQVKS